jgi:hypothetical protein
MKKFISGCFLALVILAPLHSWAQDEAAPKEQRISVDDARESELARRALLNEHISWQWVVATKVSRRSQDPVLGAFVGMEGDMGPGAFDPSGRAQTLAWLSPDGKLIWSSSFLQKKDGAILHRFRAADGVWVEDPHGLQGAKALHDILGVDASYEDLRNWLSGVPGHDIWPRKFARAGNSVYPVKSSIQQGRIKWGGWMEVETEKKQKMPMPGTWELYADRAKIEFALISFEGYAADELPDPSWPYVSGKKDSFLNAEEEPIAKDDELDYKSW